MVDARIDLNALRENYMRIRSVVAGARISAVVKDNAYGHGLDLVVECLRDLADGFCVATIQEGISLRSLGVTQPIWILTGFHTAEELEASISLIGLELNKGIGCIVCIVSSVSSDDEEPPPQPDKAIKQHKVLSLKFFFMQRNI